MSICKNGVYGNQLEGSFGGWNYSQVYQVAVAAVVGFCWFGYCSHFRKEKKEKEKKKPTQVYYAAVADLSPCQLPPGSCWLHLHNGPFKRPQVTSFVGALTGKLADVGEVHDQHWI